MSIALVGGLDRLKRQYEHIAKGCGVNLKTFTGKESCLVDNMGQPEMVILLTDMVSHQARRSVINYSRSLGTPVIFLHSNGVSGLRRQLTALTSEGKR
ncbi:MAG: DUF2325 domain-containing protein [Deltaproteobacteria bacterium]|jgi:hypothetical protein|nr:DUF2325 domain-containing protein [Deltaproteobacteria bacterium]